MQRERRENHTTLLITERERERGKRAAAEIPIHIQKLTVCVNMGRERRVAGEESGADEALDKETLQLGEQQHHLRDHRPLA